MALPLLPLLLLAAGGAVVVSATSKKKSRGRIASSPARDNCKGIEILWKRASRDGLTILDQSQKAVLRLSESGKVRPMSPPRGMGLGSEESDKEIYAVARAAYRELGCGEPPLPGQGTVQQRALFALMHYHAWSLIAIQYMGGAWLPRDYMYRGLPTLTAQETRGLVNRLSKPAAFLKTEAQNYELFNKQWLTPLEQRMLRARADFYSYNRGGPLRSKSLQVPPITQLDTEGTPIPAEDLGFHEAQWMVFKETGRFAHPSTYDLIERVGVIGNWAWWWSANPNQPFVEILCEPGLPCFVRANSLSGDAVIKLVTLLHSYSLDTNGTLAYGDDVEAQAAAGILMATSEGSIQEPGNLALDWLTGTNQDKWDIAIVPPLAAILNSSSMSEERSNATSELFIQEPILARLWSITVDEILEREGEIMAGFA